MATWVGYVCEDCGWRWPSFITPVDGDECDACGGELEKYEIKEDD